MGSAPGFGDLDPAVRPRVEKVVEDACRDALARAGAFEFTTYRIGTRPVPDLAWDADGAQDLVRAVVRVELRSRLEAAWPARRFDPDGPDMIVEVRPWEVGAGVWFEPQAAFVAGRYRKLSRAMSQTVLHCHRCRGRGRRRGVDCAACGGTGRGVPEAVEDFVVPALCEALGGREGAFHGAGREDVDVRMLGDGRPFVVTVEGPVRRTLDADAVAARVAEASGGRVEVEGLRVVGRATKRRLTTEHGEKRYRVVVAPVGDAVLPADAAGRLAALSGATLDQRNPSRVPRRADVVRRRTLRALEVEEAGPRRVVLRVTTDAGLYVKEMVSGDGGRTAPSVAAALGVPCVCAELDVVGVSRSAASA